MTDEDVLPIVQCGDPVLRRAAEPVDPTDLRAAEPVDPTDLRAAELRRLIAQMRATMEAASGVGLAAPQVGVPLQLAVLQDGPERWGEANEDELAARERHELPFTVLVNPVVTPVDGSGLAGFYEGCCGGGRPGSSSTRPTTSAGACTWTGPSPGRCRRPTTTSSSGPGGRQRRRRPVSDSRCVNAPG